VEKFLDPFLRKKIENLVSEANIFNKNVLTNLTKTVKRGNVKFKTSSTLSCNRCSQVADSVSQLHEHMQNIHEFSSSIQTESAKFQSTRNNSNVESLMIEDVSLNVLLDDSIEKPKVDDDEPTLDEAANVAEEQIDVANDRYKCDIFYKDNSPCVYRSTTATEMLKHTELVHGDKKDEEVMDTRNAEIKEDVKEVEPEQMQEEEKTNDSQVKVDMSENEKEGERINEETLIFDRVID
jgi:hypothetical protein